MMSTLFLVILVNIKWNLSIDSPFEIFFLNRDHNMTAKNVQKIMIALQIFICVLQIKFNSIVFLV